MNFGIKGLLKKFGLFTGTALAVWLLAQSQSPENGFVLDMVCKDRAAVNSSRHP